MTDVASTIIDRTKTHGEFRDVAETSGRLKRAMAAGKNWDQLQGMQREALEMIAHKVARILSGDADDPDHWHDVAGYAVLIETRLKEGQLK